ncbi:MAG TPA: FHA domain-containing protein [Dehalococcoidia bacterium]|nr:FHA domain-containing protein [Dehalococcoidia bacterium]
MKKIIVAMLILILLLLTAGAAVQPVQAQDLPFPPLSPDALWQPPYDGIAATDPQVGVEIYRQTWPNLQLSPPAEPAPGIPGSIGNAFLVNNYGQILNKLYRNEACYMVVSLDGPGYFYLWEYYPAGSVTYGHWLLYRWYCPAVGIWKIGPFTAEALDPAGQYTWKVWFLSGLSWSTHTLDFNFSRSYYPPDIPWQTPEPVHPPQITSFSASKSAIQAGEMVVLSWATSNSSSISLSPGIGAVALSGSTMVTPVQTSTYTLTANGQSGNPVSSSVTVTVLPRTLPVIRMNPTNMRKGSSASLAWEAPGAVRVWINGIGETNTSGSMQVSPEKTTTYEIKAAYPDGGLEYASATISVEQPPYLLLGLIGLLSLAAIAIVILLFLRRKNARNTRPSDTQAGYVKRSNDIQQHTDVLPPAMEIPDAIPARLVMPDGSEILLAGNSRSFGRNDFKNFMPQENPSYISRQHVDIWYENGQYFVADRNSTNGTKVNDINIKGIGRQPLADGDVIELAGKLRFTFKQNTDKEV